MGPLATALDDSGVLAYHVPKVEVKVDAQVVGTIKEKAQGFCGSLSLPPSIHPVSTFQGGRCPT